MINISVYLIDPLRSLRIPIFWKSVPEAAWIPSGVCLYCYFSLFLMLLFSYAFLLLQFFAFIYFCVGRVWEYITAHMWQSEAQYELVLSGTKVRWAWQQAPYPLNHLTSPAIVISVNYFLQQLKLIRKMHNNERFPCCLVQSADIITACAVKVRSWLISQHKQITVPNMCSCTRTHSCFHGFAANAVSHILRS